MLVEAKLTVAAHLLALGEPVHALGPVDADLLALGRADLLTIDAVDPSGAIDAVRFAMGLLTAALERREALAVLGALDESPLGPLHALRRNALGTLGALHRESATAATAAAALDTLHALAAATAAMLDGSGLLATLVAAMPAAGLCCSRGRDCHCGNARGEEKPGHQKISFRTARTVLERRRSETCRELEAL
ncbi:MAG: hypothetical protein ACJ8FL_07645 [Sphingomicrobium sp.]